MVGTTNRVHLIKQLDVTDLSGEKVMIDFETGKYFLLKGSANEIWDMISEDIAVDQIIDNLLSIYDVDRETCQASVISFLNQMEENGFISLS